MPSSSSPFHSHLPLSVLVSPYRQHFLSWTGLFVLQQHHDAHCLSSREENKGRFQWVNCSTHVHHESEGVTGSSILSLYCLFQILPTLSSYLTYWSQCPTWWFDQTYISQEPETLIQTKVASLFHIVTGKTRWSQGPQLPFGLRLPWQSLQVNNMVTVFLGL